MLFNTSEFLLFLPIVFLLYWFVFRPRRWQNLLIVIASYIFYGWWDWRFLILIAMTSICSYASGIFIERYEGHRKAQLAISVSNIVLNTGILGVFKYYNFFVDNLNSLFCVIGLQLDWATINVILPVGISFYTFQALSYTIDVYQKKLSATHDIVGFFAYISFFPQLVAGPIERATNLLPQFQQARKFDYAKAVDGCRQMLWGYFKKVVVADNCALGVEAIWGSYSEEPSLILIIGSILFTFQIYCDFSGYSDIAIGCARLFGINLMRNFNLPYLSRSIPEFWRRWHMSLMTWFRDYIYIPLGGSRCSKTKIVRNTIIVFGISGLWHGANWTFICWGLYHACLIALFIFIGINTKNKEIVAKGKIFPSFIEFFQMLITFILVNIGWIIFRAETMHEAVHYLSSIFDMSIINFPVTMEKLKGLGLFTTICALLFFFVVEWLQREKTHGLEFAGTSWLSRSVFMRFLIYIVLALFVCGNAGVASEFIYFQF